MTKKQKRTAEQIRAYERARYAANRDRERERKRIYAKTEKRKQQVKRWREKNPTFYAEWQRKQRQKWKIAAMKALGGIKCRSKGCDVSGDPDVLEIDHILDDGVHERKTIFGTPFFRTIALNPDKKRHQVLCCNHNRKKQMLRLKREKENG